MPGKTQPSATAPNPIERWLIALIAVAAYSMLPPYLGPLIGLELDVAASVEVIDHVIPGALAIAAGGLALSFARRGETDSIRALSALGVCALCALMQTVSHIPLVLEAGEPQAPVDSVILHSSPGPVLLALSVLLLLRPSPEDAKAGKRP